MKITDYIHLYLGCEVQCPKLAGWIHSQRKVILTLDFWYKHQEKKLIPILRPLSDITEKEVLEICEFVSPIVFGDFRYKKWKVSIGREWDHLQKDYDIKREGDEHSFTFDCIDGDVLLWEDDKHIDAPLMNFNYRFELIKKHFDLFGLIEAGLAIDKTTLK